MNVFLGFPFFFKVLCSMKVCLSDNIINHFIINVQLEIIFSCSISRKPLQNLFIATGVNILWPEIICRIYSVPLPELAAGLPLSANTSLCLQTVCSTFLELVCNCFYLLWLAYGFLDVSGLAHDPYYLLRLLWFSGTLWTCFSSLSPSCTFSFSFLLVLLPTALVRKLPDYFPTILEGAEQPTRSVGKCEKSPKARALQNVKAYPAKYCYILLGVICIHFIVKVCPGLVYICLYVLEMC